MARVLVPKAPVAVEADAPVPRQELVQAFAAEAAEPDLAALAVVQEAAVVASGRAWPPSWE